MKIAIDISPLQSGHKVRGVGFYLEYLKRSLLKHYPNNSYIFFSQGESVDEDVDLVHYPYFDPFFITLPLVKKHKTIVTVHDVTPLVFPKHFPAGIKGKLIWQLQKFNLQGVDAIITDSLASKKDISSITGINESKITVTHLAAGEEFKQITNQDGVNQVKEKYKLPEKFVLYVGDVTWNKNVPRLVQAIQEINLTLVVVGKSLAQNDFDRSNPWNHSQVAFNTLVENDKRIIRLGFVPTDDLVSLYNAATVFAFPSIYEGFGLPVLEAMQSGCPVVTTRGGSLKEVAGDAAYFVDEYDIQSIANGIGEVFFSKKLQKELTEKGLKQASKFNWKKTAEETIHVYKKIA